MKPATQSGLLIRRRQLCVLLALISHCFSLKATEDIFSLSFDELLNVKITGASLTDETLQTAPAAVSVFTGEELNQLSIQTIGELMNYVPGFQMARNSDIPFQESYSARARRTGASSRESLILVDGMRIDSAYAGGTGFTVPTISSSNIERIEFIRGPASALYGSNAFLGVVNIITRKNHKGLKVGAGTHSSRRAEFSYFHNSDDLRLNFHFNTHKDDGSGFTARDRFPVPPRPARDPNKSLNANLSLEFGRTKIQAIHFSNESTEYYSTDSLSEEHNFFDGQLSNVSLQHSLFEDNNHLQVDLVIGFKDQKNELAAANSSPGVFANVSNPPSDETFYGIGNFEEHEAWASLQGSYEAGNQVSYQFGFDYRSSEFKSAEARTSFDLGDVSSGTFPIRSYPDLSPPVSLLSESKESIYSAYVQAHTLFNNEGELTLGLRSDNFSKSDSNVSPRIAYVYPITHTQSLKAVWGEAFRAPAFNERFVQNNPLVFGDPDLEAEIVRTTELSWVGNWDWIYATTTLFQNQFEDPIIQELNNNLRTFINGPSERSRGIECELIAELTPQLTARGSYTKVFEKPDSTFRESDEFASVSFNWRNQRINLNLSATYNCGRQTLGAPGQPLDQLDHYWLYNSKISIKASDQANLYLSARNLFDKEYRTPSQGYVPGGIQNRGQEIEAGVLWNF